MWERQAHFWLNRGTGEVLSFAAYESKLGGTGKTGSVEKWGWSFASNVVRYGFRATIQLLTDYLASGKGYSRSPDDQSLILEEFNRYWYDVSGWGYSPSITQGAATEADVLAFIEREWGASPEVAKLLWSGVELGGLPPDAWIIPDWLLRKPAQKGAAGLGVLPQSLPDDWETKRYLCLDYLRSTPSEKQWISTDKITPLLHIGGAYRYACFDRLTGIWYQADTIALPKEVLSLLRDLIG